MPLSVEVPQSTFTAKQQDALGTATENSIAEAINAALANGVFVPIGTVVAFAGASAPAKWLLCDNAAVSRTKYVKLWQALGSPNTGDGSTTFNLPDARGRVIAMVDGGASRLTGAFGAFTGSGVGSSGGSQSHQLIPAEHARHSHVVLTKVTLVAFTAGAGNNGWVGQVGDDSGFQGGDDPHNNVQPTLLLNYLIFAGVDP